MPSSQAFAAEGYEDTSGVFNDKRHLQAAVAWMAARSDARDPALW